MSFFKAIQFKKRPGVINSNDDILTVFLWDHEIKSFGLSGFVSSSLTNWIK